MCTNNSCEVGPGWCKQLWVPVASAIFSTWGRSESQRWREGDSGAEQNQRRRHSWTPCCWRPPFFRRVLSFWSALVVRRVTWGNWDNWGKKLRDCKTWYREVIIFQLWCRCANHLRRHDKPCCGRCSQYGTPMCSWSRTNQWFTSIYKNLFPCFRETARLCLWSFRGSWSISTCFTTFQRVSTSFLLLLY